MSDRDPLRAFVETGSEEAFAHLVASYAELVYTTARRQVGNAHLPEDVTQAVFILLGKKARRVARERVLAGWLVQATYYAAAHARRAEARRREHERKAAAMRSEATGDGGTGGADRESDEASHAAIERALARLSTGYRDVILLRYWENKTYPEVSRAAGIGEATARKRVERALTKMRGMLAREGCAVSEAGVERMLARPATGVMPAGMVAGLAAIAHLRNALAASAIEEVSPDLVIFDEFQRFQDLLDPPDDLDPAARRVIGRLRGDDAKEPPALLLLSATPYRVFTRRWEEETGPSHREEFFDLVEFLYGSDSDAKRRRGECEDAFLSLERELRKGRPVSPEATAARQAVEALLCPIIARTERASHENGWDHFHTQSLPAPIAGEDIGVFKHLSGSFAEDQRSSAVPYWTSIPLPMQTMGNHYVAWKLAKPVPADGVPHLSEAMRDRFERPRLWPHPRLRAIKELLPLKQMALPWLAPTAPWWPLRGAWQDRGALPRKVLVFSRFRAVPQAVAAALSFDLEAQFLAEERLAYSEVSKRRLLSATEKRHALLGLFHPSPFLVTATDPLAAGSNDLQVIRRSVRQQLKQALKGLGVRINDNAGALPTWRALARIENRAGHWDWISRAWWDIRGEVATGEEDSGLAQLLSDWDTHAGDECDAIKPSVLESLVDFAIGSPGVAVGRALLRHWSEAVSEAGFVATLDATWNGLRTYLDQRWFYHALRKGEEGYPDALLRSVVDGNLEAVLDEHLWITSRLGSFRGEALAHELKDGMTIKSGLFHLHPVEGDRADTFSVRCHVAMPFVQSRVASLDGGEKPVRADELRRAFNTPFWPYLLATTSVGQEGLDFHSWCDTLVHWDLCRNPVDLEQREGRIQRFGSLSVRRAIAKAVGGKALASGAKGESPWARIAELADGEMSDASGLAPWWVCPGGNVSRYVFSVPTSEERHWLHWMREQRLLYRLALGQPNQEDLLEILSSKAGMDPASVRRAVINLSPWFRRPKL